MNIAVAHEHYREWGGGEHVAEALASTFDCPVYAGMVAPDCPTGEAEVHDLFGGRLGPLMLRSTLFRDLTYMIKWPSAHELTGYDVVIESGNNPGWYVPMDHQAIVKYVHSPLRNPYDLFHEADSAVVKMYSAAARVLYHHTTSYPDVFVFNSEITARRGEIYWGLDRDSDRVRVVHPPVDVDSFGSDISYDEDFYLVLSRLVDTKRVESVVRAFSDRGERLVVAGDGPERDRLEEMAGDNVEFVGFVSEDRKRALMSKAKAGVFSAISEDFGMVPVEYLASGTPVIGVDEGFTSHQIEHGANGLLYEHGELGSAIDDFEESGVSMDDSAVESTADRYSFERFEEGMREAVEYARSRAEVSV